jgi:hypothetical protein
MAAQDASAHYLYQGAPSPRRTGAHRAQAGRAARGTRATAWVCSDGKTRR